MNLIKKVNRCFDYMYYRTAARDVKHGTGDGSAFVTVVGVQTFMITILLLFIGLSLLGREKLYTIVGVDGMKFIFLMLLILLSVFNYKKYKGKFPEFQERWEDESKYKKRLHGFSIVVSYIILISGLIGVFYLFD